MKKLISILLVLASVSLVLASCGGGSDDTTTTTTTAAKTTTKKLTTTTPKDDTPEPESITLIVEGENGKEGASEWTYKTFLVDFIANGGVMDYLTWNTNDYKTFLDTNVDWAKGTFDATEWTTAAGPFGDRAAGCTSVWSGTNHGFIAFVKFNITQEQIDLYKAGTVKANIYTFYDNSVHMYINGTEFYSNDQGDLFQEGVAGNSLGIEDWCGGYINIDPDDDDHDVYDTGTGSITELLVPGENVFAVRLLDCWGGREFDLGFELFY